MNIDKGLEALKQVKNFLGYNYCSVDLPNELEIIEKELKTLEILKKHFNFKFNDTGDMFLVSIQSKEDEDTWDTTACANIKLLSYNPNIYNENAKDEFDTLKEVLENEKKIN